MYDEYPTVYESNLSYEKMYFIIFICVLLVLLLVTLYSMGKVFKKAGRSEVSGWIPFYNIFGLLEIVNMPKINFFLALIPGANILVYSKLVSLFKKNKSFSYGLSFLPFVFYPILAFDKSEYIGINIIAMEGKSEDTSLPDVVVESDEKVLHAEQDTSSLNTSISMGGGVYEKEYSSELIGVDSEKVIEKATFAVKPDLLKKDIYINRQMMEPVVEKEVEPMEATINFPDVATTYSEPTPSVEKFEYVANTTVKDVTEDGKCPNCGAAVKPGADACFLCGQKLK